ncbi:MULTISPECIES: XdhC family protein [Symbiopectobacterium]|uniref:XdhC family protein n=1 Tax=Symbiopectobacterium TaxID=801 RepID=UPI001A195EEB|nr:MULTISPECIES: XdhC family protein [Symbiopectobacterium]MBG6248552.1 XdhC family protein [Candidatus Symbiopectobacterium sp. PLON1]MBT9428841.1 XdhC family protein [Candidatus Symbiopectobacterium endolongispinus]
MHYPIISHDLREVCNGAFYSGSGIGKNNRAFAFIQIVESRGSTPRHNASMLVDEDGNSMGTIGGGMM